FTASVNDDNIGYVNAHTVTFPNQAAIASANSMSTCTMDETLWHKHCCHRNWDTIQAMHTKNVVKGMKCILGSLPHDLICPPCLARKQHCYNIP
ncbi:hypothetical protein ARMGADRAFT_941325, partial [Armillaria gallica]